MKNSLIFLLGLGVAAGAQAAPQYTISGIQTAEGYATSISGINDSGWVSGAFRSTGGVDGGFFFNGSTVTQITPANATSTIATGINNSGLVGGVSYVDNIMRPFLYDGTGLIDLAALDPVVQGSSVLGLNNQNDILLYGFSFDTGSQSFVIKNYLYDGSSFTMPSTIVGGNALAFGLSDTGGLTGAWTTESGNSLAFRHDANGTVLLPTLGGTGMSVGESINSSGWVTGYSTDLSGNGIAFLSDGTQTFNLGTLLSDPGSVAPGAAFFHSAGFAINDQGIVGGHSLYDGGGTDTHGFVYRDGTMYDLNDLIDQESGWVITQVSDINEFGQIVGTGLYNGEQRGFVLTPFDAEVIGQSMDNPLMPTVTIGNEFTFSANVEVVGQWLFFDPLVATGYDFAVEGNLFTSALFTSDLIDPDGYQIYTADGLTLLGTAYIGEVFNFETPLSAFSLRGIAPQNMLDPEDPLAFVAGFTFASTGGITLTQTAFTEDYTPGVPEPASWAMMIAGFGLVGGSLRRRHGKQRRSLRFA